MKKHLIFIIAVYFGAQPVFAQTQNARNPDYSVSVFTQFEYDDNATRIADAEVEELQSILGARIGYDFRGSQSHADINYDLRRTQFSEDSQEDESTVVGSASLDFGESYPVGINFLHSIDRILNEPDDAPLLANSQNRQLIAVSPRARLRLDTGTHLSLSFTQTEVDFKDSSDNDSSRSGLEVNFNRLISQSTTYGLGYSFLSIDFANNDAFNYEQQRVFGIYNLDLERFNYLLRLGASKTQSDNVLSEDSTDLFLEFEAGYTIGANRIALELERVTTDSSVALGSTNFQDSLLSVGGSANTQDQIDSQSASINVVSQSICRLCRLRLFVEYEELDYFIESENDQEQLASRVELNYRLSPSFDVTGAFRFEQGDFPSNEARTFDRTTISANIAYRRERIEVQLAAENQEQSFDNSEIQGFTANLVRLRLETSF